MELTLKIILKLHEMVFKFVIDMDAGIMENILPLISWREPEFGKL